MAVEPLERALERAALQTATHDAADLVARDEPGILQDAQMLDKTRQRHPERLGQLADRMLAVAELRQHGAPRRIGERAEYGVETAGCYSEPLVHFMRAAQGCQVQRGNERPATGVGGRVAAGALPFAKMGRVSESDEGMESEMTEGADLATIAKIRQRLRDAGAKPAHEEAVLRAWTHALPLASGSRAAADFLPLSLRGALPAIARELDGLARVHSEHAGHDWAARLLVALGDGRTFESVLLPPHGLCVSTQVGCAVGCVFCMTGRDGLQRHLGSAALDCCVPATGL